MEALWKVKRGWHKCGKIQLLWWKCQLLLLFRIECWRIMICVLSMKPFKSKLVLMSSTFTIVRTSNIFYRMNPYIRGLKVEILVVIRISQTNFITLGQLTKCYEPVLSSYDSGKSLQDNLTRKNPILYPAVVAEQSRACVKFN